MFLITTFVGLTIAIIAGVMLGTDLSRPVNLFPGCLIITLACANFLVQFGFLTSITTGCLYFLMGWLAIIVIYLVEKQRPLAKAHQHIDREVKWWLKELVKTVFQRSMSLVDLNANSWKELFSIIIQGVVAFITVGIAPGFGAKTV